jgi:hypothetical protein
VGKVKGIWGKWEKFKNIKDKGDSVIIRIIEN